MNSDTIHTPRTRPRRWHRPISKSAAVGLTLASFGAAFSAYWVALAIGMCGFYGETCSAGELRTQQRLIIAGLVLTIGGPILVAWLRRAAVWALSPAALVAGLFVGGHLVQWGNRLFWGQ